MAKRELRGGPWTVTIIRRFFALDDHGTDFAWGGGAQAHFGALGLRLEYEQFNVRNTDGVKAVSFDVSWHFL